MPFLSAIVGVLDALGVRVDRSGIPAMLKLGAGLSGSRTTNGGIDIVTLAVTGGDGGAAALGVEASTPDTIPLRGSAGQVKCDFFEADGGGAVATTGDIRLPQNASIVGRVATGGGANAPMATFAGTSYYLGSYQTAFVARTAANIELQYGASNTPFGRFTSGAPSQSLDMRLTSIGPQWYESTGLRRAARRFIPVTALTTSVVANDGEFITADGDIVTTGVLLKDDIGAEECAAVIVEVPAGAATNIIPATDNGIMGGGTYAQPGGTTCMYISNGNGDYKRIIFA